MEARAPVRIRYGEAGDATLLAELGARTFADSFADQNTPEDMAAYLAASFGPEIQAAELADPRVIFLIAEIQNTPVGFVKLREGAPTTTGGMPGASGPGEPMPASLVGKPIELERIYSVKEWIGHGVGAALMQASLEEAARRGFDTVWLGVWERNRRALAFYHKWGFVEIGTHSFLLGKDLQTDYVMARKMEGGESRKEK